MRFLSCSMAPVVLCLLSCHSDRSPAVGFVWKEPGISDSLAPRIEGIYHGHFKEGLMTLVINYIADSNVSGYVLRRGVRRNVNGAVKQNGAALDFILKEPGNSPLDGTFYISMNPASRSAKGKWVPQNSAKIRGGPVDVKRWDKDTGVDLEGDQWRGNLGVLTIHKNGTCELGDGGVTIWGIYEQKGNTIFIEWEPNDDLPARKMKLARQDPAKEWQGPTLQGDGVKFEESTAG